MTRTWRVAGTSALAAAALAAVAVAANAGPFADTDDPVTPLLSTSDRAANARGALTPLPPDAKTMVQLDKLSPVAVSPSGTSIWVAPIQPDQAPPGVKASDLKCYVASGPDLAGVDCTTPGQLASDGAGISFVTNPGTGSAGYLVIDSEVSRVTLDGDVLKPDGEIVFFRTPPLGAHTLRVTRAGILHTFTTPDPARLDG